MYHKSELIDKQSDYEDVWTGEPLKTFKPGIKKPDLLEKISRSPVDEAENEKQASPFYAEPADSIKPEVVRRVPRTSPGITRHSDPSHFAHWPGSGNAYLSGGNCLPRIDSHTELTDSRSADNILNMKYVQLKRKAIIHCRFFFLGHWLGNRIRKTCVRKLFSLRELWTRLKLAGLLIHRGNLLGKKEKDVRGAIDFLL